MTMIPPTFSDLAKPVKDLLDKEFKFGIITLEHHAKAFDKNCEVILKGDNDVKSGKINGSLETKMKCNKNINVNSKWDTRNLFSLDLVADNLVKGLKETFGLVYQSESGSLTSKLKSSYKRPNLNCNFDIDLKLHSREGSAVGQPVITANGVMNLGILHPTLSNILIGDEAVLHTGSGQLKSSKLAASFVSSDMCVTGILTNPILSLSGAGANSAGAEKDSAVTDNRDVQLMIHHNVSDLLQIGVEMGYQPGTRINRFQAACRYHVGGAADTYIKGRIDSKLLCGISYSWKPSEAVRLTLSGQVDTRTFVGGAHNVGLSVNVTL